MITLNKLLWYGWTVRYDSPHQLDRAIVFNGPGWYSMDDNDTYCQGTFATYSRILVETPS